MDALGDAGEREPKHRRVGEQQERADHDRPPVVAVGGVVVEPEQPRGGGHRQLESAVARPTPVVDDQRGGQHESAGETGCEPDEGEPTWARRHAAGEVQVRHVLAQSMQKVSTGFDR